MEGERQQVRLGTVSLIILTSLVVIAYSASSQRWVDTSLTRNSTQVCALARRCRGLVSTSLLLQSKAMDHGLGINGRAVQMYRKFMFQTGSRGRQFITDILLSVVFDSVEGVIEYSMWLCSTASLGLAFICGCIALTLSSINMVVVVTEPQHSLPAVTSWSLAAGKQIETSLI